MKISFLQFSFSSLQILHLGYLTNNIAVVFIFLQPVSILTGKVNTFDAFHFKILE